MALIHNYEANGEVYNNAYVRIVKVRSANVDYEMFVNVDDPDRPDIAQELTWVTRIESSATAFVWPDKISRDNRAMTVAWFDFDFVFDLNSDRNIFQQAYDSLKVTNRFSGSIDV